ncbi:G-alpha-domain-containing protein [Pholiota conissans]|uniref:G-alpha-domain-containing protein n=1 Tax=Pholiota conissans TaxID=109636 RepID=A0A9P6D210_9AGAR|nr:G-alpha-domain-containing protein [Pholiota conissans]
MASLRKKASQTVQWPPTSPRVNETEEERGARLRSEAEAKRVSDMIDRQLDADRQRRKQMQGPKVLLLGQAESGKSTTLKNFQLHFAPKSFEREAEIWRPVIHLNLVRSVNFIVNFLLSQTSSVRESASSPRRRSSGGPLSSDLRRLCVRLGPLRQVEETLLRTLSGRSTFTSFDERSAVNQQTYNPAKATEVSLRSGTGWRQGFSLSSSKSDDSSGSSSRSDTMVGEDGQSRRILAALGDEIATLWKDPYVQKALQAAEIGLQEQPGFFLDQAARVTKEDYRPRPDDVLKARVTTLGPEQHTIVAESGSQKSNTWTIYDVGGSRSQRAAWAQYFDDVHAVIFLAPMSGFNQVLAEDESVNRLTDSLRLWQMICSNKILAGVEFILFLNKLDILDAKLKSGIQFSSFVTSYTNKPNETKPVAKYLLDVFITLHQQCSPKRRRLHPHLTCAVDTKATSAIISRIQEVILIKALGQTNIL